MCGLVGIFSEDPLWLDPRVLAAMRDAISHRGPDNSGLDVVPGYGIGMGFARLSIIDLTEAGTSQCGTRTVR